MLSVEATCSFVIKGVVCGEDGKLFVNRFLCEDHRGMVTFRSRSFCNKKYRGCGNARGLKKWKLKATQV